MLCVGTKGLAFALEDEDCGLPGGLIVYLAKDCDACATAGETRKG